MGKHNNFMPSKDLVYVRKDVSYNVYTKNSPWNNCKQVALTKDEWKAIRSKRIKLPKNWKHWCAVCRLKPDDDGSYHYLKGRGYHWRVNNEGMFQRGDDYDGFDRWALCDIHEVPMPKTLNEFKEAVEKLLYVAHTDDTLYEAVAEVDLV